ncbi:MAG: class I poly(R)-hydroxyalkanoic acid synthase [Pseudomonadota bacterium]|nr:class I poly(R)-hydroxyalkanoic acid synthase [Pseudomonadota bacterium]
MTQAEETRLSGKKAAGASKPEKKKARKAAKAPGEPPPPAQSGVNGAANGGGEKTAAETGSLGQAGAQKSMFEDFDALSTYLAEITGRSQEVIGEYFSKNPNLAIARGEKAADPLNISESFQEMMNSLAADPGTVMQRQLNLWGDYAKLMATMSRRMAGEQVKPAIEPSPGDKRFMHPAWRENPMLDFVKQSYLTFAKWLETTVHQLEGMDEHDKKKAEFYTRQFIDAVAPTNFAMLNPEVVQLTLETKGENLLKGMKNLLEDIDRGEGALSIRQADLDFFRIGHNIATTPGKVVYENEIMQLIQYAPATEEVARRPLLIFPPWINKFYILDLQPANSFIRWMVEQGRTVFVVSWVNPGPELRHKTFEDYIRQGLFEALDAVKLATGEEDVDAIGYCIGGTMLATGLALMARRGDDRVKSATFFTAQTDFSEAGDLSLFVDDAQLEAIEKQMDAAGGVLEGRAMATTFNMLRSNDLIWSFVIDNYMKGKDPAKFDLLYWNSDATRMPKGVHLFYLREFYQKNRLAKGGMSIDGELLSLADVKIPIFMQAGETDHIAPARSVYNSAKLFGGPDHSNVIYMLAGSGHIAGVINHPSKNKYHHSINPALPDKIEDWMAGAEKHPGSWWRYWMDWLDRTSPGKVKARIPGEGGLKAIEDAPGRYVKVKA